MLSKQKGRLAFLYDICVLNNMAKKLYVGGLSYQTNQQGLEEYFSQAGVVTSATIITDRMTGRSKGFGFVEMANDEEADNAINMFHGKDFDGRSLTVNEARPMEDRPRTGGGNFNRNSAPRSGGRDFNSSSAGHSTGRW